MTFSYVFNNTTTLWYVFKMAANNQLIMTCYDCDNSTGDILFLHKVLLLVIVGHFCVFVEILLIYLVWSQFPTISCCQCKCWCHEKAWINPSVTQRLGLLWIICSTLPIPLSCPLPLVDSLMVSIGPQHQKVHFVDEVNLFKGVVQPRTNKNLYQR